MKLKNLTLMYGVLLLSAIGFISCVKDTDYELPNLEDLKKNIPAFDGKIVTFTQAAASATTDVTPYTSNDAIEGYVVSSDEGGNFYKKIYIQNADKTAGVSVSINKSGLYTEFPVGAKVQIRLKGLTTQINNGGLEIGYDIYTSGSGRKSVGQMAEAIYKKHVYNMQESLKKRAELTKADTSIDVLKTNENVNQLITLKNVSFESSASGKTYHIAKNDPQNGTNYNLIDSNGKTITFRTSKYAKFINEPVASGLLEVTGVLTKYGSTYQFMINNPQEDIIVVGSGGNSGTITELEDSKATASDYVVGKKVKLHGKIVIDQNKPYFKFSDNTKVQIYAPKAVFEKISQEAKDKLKIEGQEITVTGTFEDYTNPKTGVTIKEIVYSQEDDLVFGTTPNVSIVELEDSKATASDYVVGKKVKLHGKIVIEQNKPYFKFSDNTMVQIYAPKAVFDKISQETKNKLKIQGQEITVTGTFEDYTNPKTGVTIKEIVYSQEADLIFGTAPDNNNGDNSGGGSSGSNIFDFESLNNTIADANKYSNTGSLTNGNVTLHYKARLDMDKFAISGKGLMLHSNKDNPYIKITFSKGVKTLKFKYKAAYTSPKNRNLVIYSGAKDSDTKLDEIKIAKDASGTHTIEINKSESTTITLKSTQGQIVIDDIEWTE
ncbi:DUF5689 domain-containing protein [Capnocytophaga cynodegmi]|uniref:DUF5689 domain-containing protein n=1 Tax=Capnocytophaga cynodegmi TaxID=28189 RepID=UPI0018E388D0|nr:DUF5689 domain-containing protein [Capnocytophaga cynodegmi]